MSQGGNRGILDPAADDSHGVDEGQPIRVLCRLARSRVQQVPHSVVGEHKAFDLLPHEVGRLGAQDGDAPQQVRLDLVASRFDFPAFVVQRGAAGRRSCC